MRPTFALALVVLALCACGPREPWPHAQTRVRAPRASPQTWDVGPELAARKAIVVDTVHAAGRDDAVAALLLAVAMGETSSMSAAERDVSKDGAGLARNYSALNVNGDFLQCVGITGQAAEDLNQDAHLADAVRAFIAGLDKYGEDRCLAFHRGGAQARDDGFSYGAAEYKSAIRSVQQFILADKTMMKNGKRIGLFIPHV